MSSLTSSIYSGAAAYGRGVSWVGAFLASLIGLVLIGIAIFILVQRTPTLTVTATVQPNSNCNFNPSSQNYSCSLNISYTVNGTTYSNQWTTTTTTNYQPGNTIPITINANNPQLIATPPPSWQTWLPWLFIIIGVVIIIIGWVSVYLASKSKLYAAATGVGSALGSGPHLSMGI